MGKVVHYEPCPKCRREGRDRRGDNLARYADGGAHCFGNCGYFELPRDLRKRKVKVENASQNKSVLPPDFSREVPASAWKWLFQWGLPYSYWKDSVGWSERDQRLVFLVGQGPAFSIGRFLGQAPTVAGVRVPRKWWVYGDSNRYVALLGAEKEGPVVLVEDLLSWHKVAQVHPCIWLSGTKISDKVIATLIALKRPVTLWLDADQYPLLAPKLNRLQTFLRAPVRYIHTEKDPKAYTIEEIRNILT